MVTLYFGLPGCGKTTLLSYLAIKAMRGKKYKNVYCNINLNLNDLIYITKDDLGTYNISDGLILFDEATLAFDSRAYKDFSNKLLSFFMLHRHFNVDIVLFSQGWDSTDKRIRQITDTVYYVFKTFITGHWITNYYRIPYGIIIPDKKQGGEKLGEIIQGYCKPNLFMRIFSHKLYRPKYYKYFDSWEVPELPALPENRRFLNAVEQFEELELEVQDGL